MTGRDLAGEGADVVLAHVLRAQPDVGIEDGLGHLAQGGERRADDDVHLFDAGQLDLEPAHEVERLGHGLVHLPVAGDNQFAFFVHSSLRAGAGRVLLPSRRGNSSR